MKISEVISRLQKIQMDHGDITCNVFDPEKAADGDYNSSPVHIGLGLDENNKATEVTFMDYETALAFTE